jgi:hypothetical protein
MLSSSGGSRRSARLKAGNREKSMTAPRPIAAIRADLQALLAMPLDEPDEAFALADEVGEHPEGKRAVDLLILVLEKNPNIDWGMPGSVVHAIERFEGYDPLLLESVRRAPMMHTLWMVNRMINGLPKTEQAPFHSAIAETATRTDVPDEVRAMAAEFVEFQKSQEQ